MLTINRQIIGSMGVSGDGTDAGRGPIRRRNKSGFFLRERSPLFRNVRVITTKAVRLQEIVYRTLNGPGREVAQDHKLS